jgi:SAM-dependent methyltransferase
MRASYDRLAGLYDQHWGHEFAVAAKSAFDAHLAHLLPPDSSVLDLCCGTGLMLAHILRSGFRGFGVDESARMLAIARTHAPGAKLRRSDMADYRTDLRFDAVVSFYNSLNHARSPRHLRATLANVAAHLRPGGLLLFDYVLPEAFETAWDASEQIDHADGAWSLHYTYDRSSGRATCLVNRKDRIRQTCFRPHQFREALAAAGFEIVSEMTMNGARPAGCRRLVLARKP